jgi:RimJ/RimL family protein N-acetyltransferase
MPNPSVFFTEPDDDLVLSVADRLTAMDALEATLMSGADARMAMLQSVRFTQRMGGICMVCMISGKPELVCGACRYDMLSDKGQIWMLHTDAVARKQRRKFVTMSKSVLDTLVKRSGCTCLDNWCLSENKQSIRWLKWLGFSFDRDVFFQGHMWRHFYITAGDDHGDRG